MKINNKLKKLTGDKLSKFIARNFEQTRAVQWLEDNFHAKDAKYIQEPEFNNLKALINDSLKQEKEKEPEKTTKTATELLDTAGYSLVKCNDHKTILSFKKKNTLGEVRNCANLMTLVDQVDITCSLLLSMT